MSIYRMSFLATFFFSMLFFSASSFAQKAAYPDTGNIVLIKDPLVDELVEIYKEEQSKKTSIGGFRIQIAASTNRTSVYELKSKFYSLYPDVKQYVIYQTPNFKLRVGNYRTRLEAYKALQSIQPQFNGAFIVQDELKLSEL